MTEPIQALPANESVGIERIGLSSLDVELPGSPVSLVVDGSLVDVAVALARYGVVISYATETASARVRGAWIARPAGDVLQSLAAQIGPGAKVLPRPGGVWWIGDPVAADLSALVLDVPAGEAGEWSSMYQTAAGQAAKIGMAYDRMVVVDQEDGLQRIEKLHRYLTRPRRQYLVDVLFIEMTEQTSRALGIDWNLNATLRVSAATAGAGGADLLGEAVANLVAAAEDTDATIRLNQRLLIVEGDSASMQDGSTIPIERPPVLTTEGTIVPGGYETLDVGVLLAVTARNAGDGLIRLSLTPEVSSVLGYRGDVPILSRRRLSSQVQLRPGDMVVMGGMGQEVEQRAERGLPLIRLFDRREHSRNSRRLFVFVRVGME